MGGIHYLETPISANSEPSTLLSLPFCSFQSFPFSFVVSSFISPPPHHSVITKHFSLLKKFTNEDARNNDSCLNSASHQSQSSLLLTQTTPLPTTRVPRFPTPEAQNGSYSLSPIPIPRPFSQPNLPIPFPQLLGIHRSYDARFRLRRRSSPLAVVEDEHAGSLGQHRRVDPVHESDAF